MNSTNKFSELISLVTGFSERFFYDGSFKVVSEPIRNDLKIIHKSFVSNILICNNQLRMILKYHYDYRYDYFIQGFSGECDFYKIDDFFLESSNLVGGRIRNLFQLDNINIGISIPLRTDGFDELYSLVNFDDLSGEYFWQLSDGNIDIPMTLYVEVLDPSILNNIDFTKAEVADTGLDDDVEFF